MAPFPHPAHRTGQADFPHPALGQDFTSSRATTSAASEHLLELIGFPISRSFTTYCVCLELRSLPSTGVNRSERTFRAPARRNERAREHECSVSCPRSSRSRRSLARVARSEGARGSLVLVDLFDNGPHIAQQGGESAPLSGGLGGIAPVPEGVPIAPWRARRLAAVHPAAPARH